MENQITLSQLAKYIGSSLPYKWYGVKNYMSVNQFANISHQIGCVTPIFRPWSHLIEKDENGVCDLERLSRIADCALDDFKFKDGEFYTLFKDQVGDINLYGGRVYENRWHSAYHQLQLFDFLFENHYNVYNVKCIYEK
jgi:hypothetical protein